MAAIFVALTLLGIIAGAIGAFVVVRQESLQADVVAHAALPGVALAYLSGLGNPLGLILFAALTGGLTLWLVQRFARLDRLTLDSALAGWLAISFGLGLVLLGLVQSRGEFGDTRGVRNFLFGQEAATIRFEDVTPLAVLTPLVLGVLFVCRRGLVVASFDPNLMTTLGLRRGWLDFVMTLLVVVVVVMGVQMVGAVLVGTLLIAPAVAARQWVDRMAPLVVLSAGLAVMSGLLGAWGADILSAPRQSVPTGPSVVLVACGFAVASWSLAPLVRRRVHAGDEL